MKTNPSLWDWVRRTPSMGRYGWAGWVLLCVALAVAGMLPDTFWAYLVVLLPALLASILIRADVVRRQTHIMFSMVSPQFPGAVMVVEAAHAGPPCKAPDCADLPPHPQHGWVER